MGNGKKGTPKERRFVDAFLGSCAGNGTAAAIAAGYSRHSARRIATRLLSTNDYIRAAIQARQAKETKRSILTAEERDGILSTMARHPTSEPFVRVAAIKELNKCSGRHSIKHVLDVTEKVADIIAASRK